jgi:hypothetical protein
MTITRILLLFSVRDGMTNSRVEWLSSSPRLKDFSFDFCYMAETEDLDDVQYRFHSIALPLRFPYIDEDYLLPHLREKTQDFKPDLLAVHLGYVVRRFPAQAVIALDKYNQEFPLVKIGIEESFLGGKRRIGGAPAGQLWNGAKILEHLITSEGYSIRALEILRRGLFDESEEVYAVLKRVMPR